eukprot:6173208-Pleurochrysis_carterae.AAC.2
MSQKDLAQAIHAEKDIPHQGLWRLSRPSREDSPLASMQEAAINISMQEGFEHPFDHDSPIGERWRVEFSTLKTQQGASAALSLQYRPLYVITSDP